MLKEIFALWLQYLRSGAYKPNKHRLTDGKGRFSPLGVLADLLIKEYGEGNWCNLDGKFNVDNPPYKYGFAWRYKPKFAAVDKDGNRELIPADDHVKYNVYLPKEQWFWPGVTFDIQDRIYSWTDCKNFTMSQVADSLEDGHYFN